jgi:hypothetical protein
MTLSHITPPPASPPDMLYRYCDGCERHVLHARTPDGAYLCGQGHDAAAQQLADERVMAVIEAVARMFLGMEQERRRRWFAVLVDLLGPLKQDLLDEIGRSDF